MKVFNINTSLGFIIGKTSLLIKSAFNREMKDKGFNTTVEQWSILNAVYKNPGISQSDIAKASVKDKTNITRIIDLLEKKEYLIRKNDKNDRRLYRIFLTDKGEKILNNLFPIATELNKNCSENISVEELEIMKTVLNRICVNVMNLNQE